MLELAPVKKYNISHTQLKQKGDKSHEKKSKKSSKCNVNFRSSSCAWNFSIID